LLITYVGRSALAKLLQVRALLLRLVFNVSGFLCSHCRKEILARLYHYNNRPDVAEIKPVKRRKRNAPVDIHEWGGGRSRLMLHAVYVIAFLCLLRFDEALKIQIHDIRRLSETSFELNLPFRKTSQYGGEINLFLFLLFRAKFACRD
jgi:hypothetical protein